MADQVSGREHDILIDLRRRRRWLNALHGAARGVLVGTIGVALIALAALFGAPNPGWIALVAICVIATGVGAIIGAMRPIDELRLARAMDHAAGSADRFATLVQIGSDDAGRRRADRTQLLREDALESITDTPSARALPWRAPRDLRWAALALVIGAGLLLIAPTPPAQATAPPPEISAEQWDELAGALTDELDEMPEPESETERDLREKLEELAALLAEHPEKRRALESIARLRQEVDDAQSALGDNKATMKEAARRMSRSEALKRAAALMRQGEYKTAAEALKAMAEQLKQGEMSPTAEAFEQMATDLENMAGALPEGDLKQAAGESANAAAQMNRDMLAEALKRMGDAMNRDAARNRQMDRLRDMKRLLEEMRRRMNEQRKCKACGDGKCRSCGACGECDGKTDGCAACEGRGQGQGLVRGPGSGRGGLKAGQGSATEWAGGTLDDREMGTDDSVIDPMEQAGEDSRFTMISPDERADSAMSYEQMYAEFVEQAEADLNLDDAPIAYREFLRRYFQGIAPEDAATPEPTDTDTPVE